MDEFIGKWLPIIVAGESVCAGIIMMSLGRYGSGLYWLSVSAVTCGVILIPKFG